MIKIFKEIIMCCACRICFCPTDTCLHRRSNLTLISYCGNKYTFIYLFILLFMYRYTIESQVLYFVPPALLQLKKCKYLHILHYLSTAAVAQGIWRKHVEQKMISSKYYMVAIDMVCFVKVLQDTLVFEDAVCISYSFIFLLSMN